MALTGNQLAIHDQVYAVAQALANLNAAIAAAVPILEAAGATNTLPLVTGLQAAVAPFTAPIAAASAAVVDEGNATS